MSYIIDAETNRAVAETVLTVPSGRVVSYAYRATVNGDEVCNLINARAGKISNAVEHQQRWPMPLARQVNADKFFVDDFDQRAGI